MATQCQLWTSLQPSRLTCGPPNTVTRSCVPICLDFSIDLFKKQPHGGVAGRPNFLWRLTCETGIARLLRAIGQPVERSSFGRRPNGPPPAFCPHGHVSLHFPAAHYGSGAVDF